MDSLFIIDASGYLYRSYFAIRNMTNDRGESTNALFGFIRSVLKLFKDFHPSHVVAVFDGPRSIVKREAIYSEYKAHRSAMPPDLLYQIGWARDFCAQMGIPYLNVAEVEADDSMGSVAVWGQEHFNHVYLCTSDKDMAQLVNEKIKILNTHKENLILGTKEVEEVYGVPPSQMIDLLAITGDSSDNIPGIPGFGPKTAASLLRQFGSLDYILKHPEAIENQRRREIIEENKEEALLSKQLVSLHLDVPVSKETEFYRLKSPDLPQLRNFYSSMSFSSLIKELDVEKTQLGEPQEHEAYTLVDDEKAFAELLELLSKQKEICIDTETTDPLPFRAELVGVGFGFEPRHAWYVPVNGNLGLEKVLKGIKPLLENPNIGFFGHNIKYDYHILWNLGIKIAHISFDTILASYTLNSHQRQHSLDQLCLQYFSKTKIPISDLLGKGKKMITMREAPIDKVCFYCCEDVDFTCRLKGVLEKEIQERKLGKLLYELELPLLKVLAEMERRGIYLDTHFMHTVSKEVSHAIQGLEKEIYGLAGEQFNLNSPKQLSVILFEKLGIKAPKKTATGLSTNVDVLESLKDTYPIAGKILEYRSLEKLRSTYIDVLPHEINPKTGRIHCTFNQSVAATGRLSSQDPNLQNIPVRTEMGRKIREAFKPQKEGWSFLGADYSQIELRLLAHLSEDPLLLTAFQNGEDIHAFTASEIFGVALKEVTQEQRYQAKAVNFGMIYGQQAYGLSQELGISVKDAALFISTYFHRYSRVKEYLEHIKEMAHKTGKATTFTGRERLIPEIHSKNGQIRALAERLAVNTPFQGTAADLIKLAMLDIEKTIKKEKKIGYMILQIHDELIFEIPDFEIISFESFVRQAMEGVVQLKVPLIVDITIGKNWKEC